MKRSAALLAAIVAIAATGCGDDGAEPGAPSGAARSLTLVLDFAPNAVHAGIYAALERGFFDDLLIDPEVRAPGESTDAPKLLRAGRADLAILDIHDLAIARERGADLVGVGAIVQRPLAAVIAGDRGAIRRPADLSGKRVGVTGLPSDDAVLDTVLESAGIEPGEVERITTGFDSVAALASGRVDAATAFWNAEGVELERLGVPTREFRVDEFGAPRYPELVLVTTRETLEAQPALIDAALGAILAGTQAMLEDPDRALADLLDALPELDRESQKGQLDSLIRAEAFEPAVLLQPGPLREWARFDLERGIVSEPITVGQAFSAVTARPTPPVE